MLHLTGTRYNMNRNMPGLSKTKAGSTVSVRRNTRIPEVHIQTQRSAKLPDILCTRPRSQHSTIF